VEREGVLAMPAEGTATPSPSGVPPPRGTAWRDAPHRPAPPSPEEGPGYGHYPSWCAASRSRRPAVVGPLGPRSVQSAGRPRRPLPPTPRYTQPPAALPSNSPNVSLIKSRLTGRPRRWDAGWLTIVGFQALAAENFRSGTSRRNHRRSPGAITSKKTRCCAVCDFTR
jgi:hypothetical protein